MKKSFTLIELLVVIAIIAILAGLVMPALGHAQARGRTTECINNKKQIMTVLRMYGNDHTSMIPYQILIDGTVRPYSWILGGCQKDSGNYSREMVSQKVLVCNTATKRDLINDDNEGVNEATNAVGMTDVDFSTNNGWYKTKRTTVGRFVAKEGDSIAYVLEKMKAPSNMILLADSFNLNGDIETPYWTFSPWQEKPQMNTEANKTEARIAIPHAGSTTVAYADGRAEALTVAQLQSGIFKVEGTNKFYYYDDNMDAYPKKNE